MKRPVRSCALLALTLSVFLSSGCGAPTTNDENVVQGKGGSSGPDIPVFKSYGERVLYEQEQAAKKKAEEKGKTTGKASSKK